MLMVHKMPSLKILILLMYFDRPKMVRNALNSILLADKHYKNWVLGFYDDASVVPGEPIVREILAGKLNQVNFHRLNMTPKEKAKTGGIMGAGLNKILDQTDADIGIMLCDDDALHPMYLYNLNRYFNKNPDVNSCHSNVIDYNPSQEELADVLDRKVNWNNFLNHQKGSICAASKVDASQVAWRMTCKTRFASPLPKNHDHYFYESLYRSCGPTYYSGFISQFKGLHNKQLSYLDFKWAVLNSDKLE